MFNIKKDKKVKKQKPVSRSIDSIHDEKMLYFKELQTKRLPLLKRKLQSGKCDKKTVQDEIDAIVSKNEENDYFLNTCTILSEYFSLEEESATIIDMINLTVKNETSRRQQLIESYYEILGLCKKEVLQVSNINNYCSTCDTEMLLTSERYFTCVSCGMINPDKLIDGLNYEERCQNNQVFVFDYKRVNYFAEWLTQIQANEHTDIPHELIEVLKKELMKRKIYDNVSLTQTKLKKILKEINQSKYYEHIPLLISRLCGSKPLMIPENLCSKFKEMFIALQQPFEKLKGDRKNFFSYPYVLYKFCELLDEKEYLQNFQLLKREKLLKQDILWKKVVVETYTNTNDPLWKFIPSC
jgi:hypothetical protein